MKALKKIYNGFLGVIEYLAIIMMAVLIVDVFTNVLCRYFLNSSIIWADELARWLFIWVAMCGAIISHEHDEHMQLELLTERLSARSAAAVKIFANCFVLVMVYFVIVGGYAYALSTMDWKTGVLRIPYGSVYIVIPAAFSFLALQTLLKVIKYVKVLVSGKPAQVR